MRGRPPRSTRTDTLLPYTTLFRSEVWQLLSAVKAEFGKFAGVLEKAHGQLDTVQNSIQAAGVRTRAIERQLKGVETLPGADAQKLLDADGQSPTPLSIGRPPSRDRVCQTVSLPVAAVSLK